MDKTIADLARRFVLLRITSMRGVDLGVFDFDYDLTWAGLFVHPDGTVLGRYGGRDAESPDGQVSLAGLRFAMQAALTAHRAHTAGSTLSMTKPVRTVDFYPAAKRLRETACIHCHQVYDFRRETLQAEKKWSLDEVWVYPQPANVGLKLDADQGDRVRAVVPGSPAAKAGIRAGDHIKSLNGLPIASLADAQYALHRAPRTGRVPITWRHGDQIATGSLALAEGWRKTDISWRWSLRGLDPAPGIQGEDLSADEKRALGLPMNHLALRQGPFLSESARQAGLRPSDVIIGIDRHATKMNGRQLQAFIRLNYGVGDQVMLHILRAGRPVDVPMKLAAKTPF